MYYMYIVISLFSKKKDMTFFWSRLGFTSYMYFLFKSYLWLTVYKIWLRVFSKYFPVLQGLFLQFSYCLRWNLFQELPVVTAVSHFQAARIHSCYILKHAAQLTDQIGLTPMFAVYAIIKPGISVTWNRIFEVTSGIDHSNVLIAFTIALNHKYWKDTFKLNIQKDKTVFKNEIIGIRT